jgi:Na+-driven multidrug efflux pump
MLTLWLPLAASIVMMVLEPSTINIGLGRTTNPELALAAYGVAFSLALLIEAPIMMLLDASVARSATREAFALVRRFTVGLGLVVTALGLIVSLTPLYGLIVEDLMNIPADVAARAQPTLQILSFWSFPIAWRRAHQGVLIRAGRTTMITAATGIRLLTLAAGLFFGLLVLPDRGSVVAGAAMVLSVSVEATLITLATRSVLRDERFDSANEQPLTMRRLWRFYRPLLTTTILRQSMRPMLNAGIAAAVAPVASLAAWPVTWGLAVLVTGPAWSLQQLTTAMVTDHHSYRRVRNFSLSLTVFFTLLLVLVAFTPLYDLVMAGVYNLSPELRTLARPATQVLAVLPLFMGVQGFLRGVLIRSGRTGKVRAAMTVNVVTLGVTLILGTTALAPTGVLLAAIATMIGNAAELFWLWRQNRR